VIRQQKGPRWFAGAHSKGDAGPVYQHHGDDGAAA